MRAAVGDAISAAPATRLPGLLFGSQADAEAAAYAEPAFYWLLVPSPQGYSVAEHRAAEPLHRGSPVTLDGVEYRVAVVARSPFLDGHPCAYLEPPATNGT